jgi:hypothetical protein
MSSETLERPLFEELKADLARELASGEILTPAQIGVVEECGRTAVLGRRIVGLAGEKGGDALAIEDAEFDGARRHRFEAGQVEAAIRAQKRAALALWSDEIESLTGGAVPFAMKRVTRKRESLDERQTSHADAATPDS